MKETSFGLVSAITLTVCLAGCAKTAKIETVETIEAGEPVSVETAWANRDRASLEWLPVGCLRVLLSLQQLCSEGATFRKHCDPNLGRELFGGRCRLGAWI